MNKMRLTYLLRIVRYGFKSLLPMAAIAALCIWGIRVLWVIFALTLLRTIVRIVWRVFKLLLCAALLMAVLLLIIL